MTEFRLTQISDPHLTRRHAVLTANFEAVSAHIDAVRPDLVVNSGDLAFDAPTAPDDLVFAHGLHAALPVPCRYLPGNHDIGDNPTEFGPPPPHPVSEDGRRAFAAVFGEERWRFEAAGWSFVGINSLLMQSGLSAEAEQLDWLTEQLSAVKGRPVALFLHKPLFLAAPGDAELAASAIRYIPPPARRKLLAVLDRADVRLVASGHVHQRRDFTYRGTRHVWAPSSGHIIPDRLQERIGLKEVGLVEYRFQPDSFEVRHIRAPGQVDIDLDTLLEPAA
jgi:3',5'-cyclic AMP phosphodiesterase CpdA